MAKQGKQFSKKELQTLIYKLNNEIKVLGQRINQYKVMDRRIKEVIDKLDITEKDLKRAYKLFKNYYSSKAKSKKDTDFRDIVIDINKNIKSLEKILLNSNNQITLMNNLINKNFKQISEYNYLINLN